MLFPSNSEFRWVIFTWKWIYRYIFVYEQHKEELKGTKYTYIPYQTLCVSILLCKWSSSLDFSLSCCSLLWLHMTYTHQVNTHTHRHIRTRHFRYKLPLVSFLAFPHFSRAFPPTLTGTAHDLITL